MYVCAQSYLTLCNPMTVAHQAPLSMKFSRQEYWSGLPFPSPQTHIIYLQIVFNRRNENDNVKSTEACSD